MYKDDDDEEYTFDDAFWDGFTRALVQVQEKITLLRKKKMFNMSADYAWALEDIATILETVAEEKI